MNLFTICDTDETAQIFSQAKSAMEYLTQLDLSKLSEDELIH